MLGVRTARIPPSPSPPPLIEHCVLPGGLRICVQYACVLPGGLLLLDCFACVLPGGLRICVQYACVLPGGLCKSTLLPR